MIKAAAALAFMAFFILGGASLAGDDVIGTVEINRGEVKQLSSEELNFTWKQVGNGATVRLGDKVKTGADTLAKVVYTDGTELKMKDHTLVEFRESAIRLLIGDTWIKMVKRGTAFEVHTPAIVAGVRGTRFAVNVQGGGDTKVAVTEGLVSVKGSGREVMVGAGRAVNCVPGSPPPEAVEFDGGSLDALWEPRSTSDFGIGFGGLDVMGGDSRDRLRKAKEDLNNAMFEINVVKGRGEKVGPDLIDRLKGARVRYNALINGN